MNHKKPIEEIVMGEKAVSSKTFNEKDVITSADISDNRKINRARVKELVRKIKQFSIVEWAGIKLR